jgi:hypothetical protein
VTRVLFLSRGRREIQFMRHLPAFGYQPVAIVGRDVELVHASEESAQDIGLPLIVDLEQPAQVRRVPAAGVVVRTPRAQQLVEGSALVPDGYDPDDFVGSPLPREDDRFRIVVDGSAAKLLEAIDWVDRERRKSIELERASEADFRTADLLFLTTHDAWSIPSRTYEYLAAGRPILAAVPDGDASDLLEHAGTAHVCGPADVKGMSGAIDAELKRWEAGACVARPHPAELAPFTWRSVTERLAAYYDAVLGREHVQPIVERLVATRTS